MNNKDKFLRYLRVCPFAHLEEGAFDACDEIRGIPPLDVGEICDECCERFDKKKNK